MAHQAVILKSTLRLSVENALIILALCSTTLQTGIMQGSQFVELTECICPGLESVAYECTVCGIGATIWTGSLFECTSNGIQLRHQRFETGASGDCNNGRVTSYSTGVSDINGSHCYSSQLRILVDYDDSNKTVTCIHVDGVSETVIGTASILITTESYPPPSNIHLSDISQERLIFRWDHIPQTNNCSEISYTIIALNCGLCPNSTVSTSITCINVTTNDRICSFAIETEVCGTIVGKRSNSIEVSLQVPDAPIIEAEQLFMFSSLSLSFIYPAIIDVLDPVNISDGIDGSISSYTISYYDSISGNICGIANIPLHSNHCIIAVQVCRHVFDTSMSYCNSAAYFTITAFATNIFGNGPPSSPVYVNITELLPLCNNCSNAVSLNDSSFDLLLTTSVGSILLLILTVSTTFFIVVTFILVKDRAKIKRDLQQAQETKASRVDYEDIDLTQRGDITSSIISTTDNVAYGHVTASPINTIN